MLKKAVGAGGARRHVRGVVVDGSAVGLLDRSQAGRDPGFVGGDVLAVAAAVRVLGQGAAEPLDLADVGFALIGIANIAISAVAASMTRATVRLSGSRRARARGC